MASVDWAGPSVLPQKRQANITAHYVRDTPWTGPGPRSFRKSDNSNCQKTVRTSCPTLRGGRTLAPERLLRRLGPKPMKATLSLLGRPERRTGRSTFILENSIGSTNNPAVAVSSTSHAFPSVRLAALLKTYSAKSPTNHLQTCLDNYSTAAISNRNTTRDTTSKKKTPSMKVKYDYTWIYRFARGITIGSTNKCLLPRSRDIVGRPKHLSQSQVDQPAILGRDGQPACGTRYTTLSMHRTVASASLPPAEALARWGEACLSSAPAWSPACPDGVARDEAEAAPRRRCTARRHLLTQCRTARVVQSPCNSLSTSSPSKSSFTTA